MGESMNSNKIQKITKKTTSHENRAILDGKIIYIVYGTDRLYEKMSELINLENWQGLSEFIVGKFILTVEVMISQDDCTI